MTLAPGTRIGSYDIVSELGSGGMGEVYRAHDTRLGRDVALKILPDTMARDPDALARFEREARAVAALNHPHIVTIYSTEEHAGVRFLTMEVVEGQTLDRLIPAGGIALDRFFDIAIALADALAAAHQKQITHRDLKPSNVMVTDDGRVKVLDFGLARTDAAMASEAATRQGLTAAGTVVGTVPYMSPEQIESRPLDHRSDVFSFGVVAYEMATGARPFAGDSSPAIMSAILRDRPAPAVGCRRDLPEAVSQLIDRCLAKSVHDRVQSAQEIVVELRMLNRARTSSVPAAVAVATAPAPSRAVVTAADLRLAVLPFQWRGGTDAEALADGLTDDVTTGLARFPYLRVVLRVDAERATSPAPDARTADALGVRYLLDGTVRVAGDAVRVSARLTNPSTGAQLWGETYDRALAGSSIFALQDDLASRIVSTVGDSAGALPRAMGAAIKDRSLDELAVSELVLRYFAYLQHFSPDEHQRLRDAFERALKVEHDHALGWACLAFFYEQELSQGVNVRPDSRGRGIRAAERAIELDPGCQTAWRSLASFHFFDRDLEALRAAAERVIALNPLASATPAVGMLLAYAGDWERGVGLVQRAIALNPQHQRWLHHVLFVDHYRKREYQEALAETKLSNMPRFILTPLMTASAAGQLGRASDVRAAFETLRTHHPSYLDARRVREHWSFWQWDEELVDRLMEGFARAQALVGADEGGAADPGKPRSGRTASIAVLPFTDLSAAKDQEWFCDGIAEEILNGLMQLPGLRVAARASAFSFRGRSDDLRTIGEKLNVTTVLGGSVRRAGDRVRITAQLSDVTNGFQLWSERYDRELRDIFDVQDEIARAIADRLKVTLAGGKDERVVEQATSNIDAYELYLKGRALLYRRGPSIPPALEVLRLAVELDPNYAAAWAGVADAYTVLSYFAFIRGADARPHAFRAANRAIELDPRSAEGYTALACAKLLYDNDRAGARQAFVRALELNPNYGQGRCWYALFDLQWACGDLERGLAEARRALDADPLSAYVTMIVSTCLSTAGQLDEAIEKAALAVRIDPESFVARWSLGVALTDAGRLDEAVDTLREAAAMSGDHDFATSGLARAFAGLGREAEAAEVYNRMIERASRRYVPATFLAATADAAGRRDEAIAHAGRAWADREPPFILLARRMSVFRSLREDPRFREILREMDAEPA